MVGYFYCKILPLLNLIRYGISVPHDYCLQPLNKNDCGKKPVAVVSYYKEGSRCEIETWRGCPTLNKFPDEVTCSHHCIFRMGGANDVQEDRPMQAFETDMAEINENPDSGNCLVPLNKSDCGVKDTYKYTFIGDMCMRVKWQGCESKNMFDDKLNCIKACVSSNGIMSLLSKLHENDTNNILENLLNDSNENTQATSITNEISTPPNGKNETSTKISIDDEGNTRKQNITETTTYVTNTEDKSEDNTTLGSDVTTPNNGEHPTTGGEIADNHAEELDTI